MAFITACRYAKINSVLLFLIFTALFLTIVKIQHLNQVVDKLSIETVESKHVALAGFDSKKRKSVWIYGEDLESGYLEHVYDIFGRLGFSNMSYSNQFDVLWSHTFPFFDKNLVPYIEKMKANQFINHIPGSAYYTSKVTLATSNFTGIPKAFKLPEKQNEFLKFASKFPDKLWVQKNNEHRGIKLDKPANLQLGKTESFVQEFISNPLLVDNKKFDIGVYTLITSIDPLRVYIFNGEALLRFCPKDYYPFSPRDPDKYVIGDDYVPVWEMPSLKKYYTEGGFTRKQTLNAYIIEHLSKDPKIIWQKIDRIIQDVFIGSKRKFLEASKEHKFKENFFELSRFDFVVDENFNVFLMEANMSPNLSSSHFLPNKLLYEQVIFNILSVLGLAHSMSSNFMSPSSQDSTLEMIVSDRDIVVYPKKCILSSNCDSCSSLICKLCLKCMSEKTKHFLKKSYLEHMHRHEMQKIVPKAELSSLSSEKFKETIDKQEFENDKLLALWFRGKCNQDSVWCH